MGEIVYLESAEDEHTFNHGFILGEDELRKIESIIIKHFPLAEPYFKVKRGFLRNPKADLKHVLQLENDVTNKISKITVVVEFQDDGPDSLDLSITFNRGKKTQLNVYGYEPDTAHVLFCELKEYIEQRIIRKNPIAKFFNSSLFGHLKSWGLFLALTLSLPVLYQIFVQETDIISISPLQFRILCISYGVIWLISILNLLYYLSSKFDFFVSRDYFLIGKEQETYKQDVERKSRLTSWLLGKLDKRVFGD